MITKLPESSEGTVGFLIHGKLTHEDYQEVLVPVLEEAINTGEKINVLFRMKEFKGWTAHGAWDDFVNWPKVRSIGRIALVFDDKWDEFMSWLFKSYAFISHIEIRFFKDDKLEEAWKWLNE